MRTICVIGIALYPAIDESMQSSIHELTLMQLFCSAWGRVPRHTVVDPNLMQFDQRNPRLRLITPGFANYTVKRRTHHRKNPMQEEI